MKAQTPRPLYGSLPPYQAVSDFQWGDKSLGLPTTATAQATINLIDLIVPRDLQNRKLYGAIWKDPSNATYNVCRCQVDFWNQNSNVGNLPFGIANLSTAPASVQTVVEVLATVTQATQDAIGVYLGNPLGTQPLTQVFLAPLYVWALVDRITVSLSESINQNRVRVFFAVVSSH